MDNPGSLKEAIIAYNSYKDEHTRNKVYILHIHSFFKATISGALLSLGVFPETIGVDKYKDLTQDMYYILLKYINSIDSITDIRDIKAYCFMAVRNRMVNYLKLHNKEVQFNYSCQRAAILVQSKTPTDD